jgi:hypothetical protein
LHCSVEEFRSKGERHLLGDGSYFYHDPDQARVWATMKSRRHKRHNDTYWAVLECSVYIENDYFIDLDLRNEQDTFFDFMKDVNRKLSLAYGVEMAVDSYTDAALCNYIAEIAGAKVIAKTFPYEGGILPTYFTNRRPREGSGFTCHYRTERQYVVRDPEIIRGIRLFDEGRVRPLKKRRRQR